MPTVELHLQTAVVRTPRVLQMEGIFDLPPSRTSREKWVAHLPFEEKPWHIGLIVGPSGSGKSSLARRLWPAQMAYKPVWPTDRAIIDAFPERMSIKQIVALLCSVGFSSPPAWLRPYRVLSTGQQFRAKLARLLSEASPNELPLRNLSADPAGSPIVCDEFSSTVDRTVARLAAHALSKAVRSRGQQLVAITCHNDIVEWLSPDWVYGSSTKPVFLEVSSAAPVDHAHDPPRWPGRLASFPKPSLSESWFGTGRGSLGGFLGRGVGCVFSVDPRHDTPRRQTRAPDRYPAGLPRRWHRPRVIDLRGQRLEGTGLPRYVDNRAPGRDCFPSQERRLADDAAAVVGISERGPPPFSPRTDATHGRIRIHWPAARLVHRQAVH
jgi:ABC-type dipeptide/oligopeptide/nickel transport system ATPase subunit